MPLIAKIFLNIFYIKNGNNSVYFRQEKIVLWPVVNFLSFFNLDDKPFY